MKDVKTLAAIAAEVESGKIYYRETTIKVGSFESFADFLSYYNQHYRPILQKVADGITPIGDEARLLRLLAGDLLEAFSESNQDEEMETIAVVILTFSDKENYKKAQRLFDSDGPSQFWAGDWNDETRTIEFAEGNDPDALGAALCQEMDAEGITGYTWRAETQRVD